MSLKTYNLLSKIFNDIILIPITAHSIRQYKRIKWPEGCEPNYAIVTNGAVLLNKHMVNSSWILHTKDFIKKYKLELVEFYNNFIIKEDILKCKIVDDMYLFLNCKNEIIANKYLEQYVNKTNLELVVTNKKLIFFTT